MNNVFHFFLYTYLTSFQEKDLSRIVSEMVQLFLRVSPILVNFDKHLEKNFLAKKGLQTFSRL